MAEISQDVFGAIILLDTIVSFGLTPDVLVFFD